MISSPQLSTVVVTKRFCGHRTNPYQGPTRQYKDQTEKSRGFRDTHRIEEIINVPYWTKRKHWLLGLTMSGCLWWKSNIEKRDVFMYNYVPWRDVLPSCLRFLKDEKTRKLTPIRSRDSIFWSNLSLALFVVEIPVFGTRFLPSRLFTSQKEEFSSDLVEIHWYDGT